MANHNEQLLERMYTLHTSMDVALLLRRYAHQKVVSTDPAVFTLINKVNACRHMVKSCMENFKTGMKQNNDFLCITNNVLFDQFFVQYLEFKNELNMMLAFADLNMKGGEKNEQKDSEHHQDGKKA